MDFKTERINELKYYLSEVKNKESFAYLQGVDSLKREYELVKDYENANIYANEIIDMLVEKGYTYNDVHANKIKTILVNAYDTKARSGDFESYCIALEWNRPIEKKFYLPRKRILVREGVMGAFQDLQDDKLDLLVLNMPPRLV